MIQRLSSSHALRAAVNRTFDVVVGVRPLTSVPGAILVAGEVDSPEVASPHHARSHRVIVCILGSPTETAKCDVRRTAWLSSSHPFHPADRRLANRVRKSAEAENAR